MRVSSNAIPQALPAADDTSLTGASPLADAYQRAVDELVAIDEGVGLYILLFAHAPATCAPDAADPHQKFEELDARLLELVEHAFDEHDIGTLVVAIDPLDEVSPAIDDGLADGVNPFDYFNDVAIAGGNANHNDPAQKFYTAADVEILTGSEFYGSVLGCLLAVDDYVGGPAPMDPAKLEVIVDGQVMPCVVDCQQAPPGGAWAYPYPGERVELCGPACTGFDETCYPEPPFHRHETTVTWDCE